MADAKKPPNEDRERLAYERLAESALEAIRDAGEVTADTISDSIDKAGEALEAAEEFTSGQVSAAKLALQLDLGALAENIGRGAVFVQDALDPGRVASGFLSMAGEVLESASDALDSWKERVRQPLLRTTGEITGPGTLTCTNCDEQIEMEDTGRVPPCWKCHRTEFRKGY